MDKFLWNYIFLGVIIISVIIGLISIKHNPDILLNFHFKPSVNKKRYILSCATYTTNLLKVNYSIDATFSEQSISNAIVEKTKIKAKNRFNLANKNNMIDAYLVKNLKPNIESDLSYNISCIINAGYKDNPFNITSYDILKITIKSSNSENLLQINDENF